MFGFRKELDALRQEVDDLRIYISDNINELRSNIEKSKVDAYEYKHLLKDFENIKKLLKYKSSSVADRSPWYYYSLIMDNNNPSIEFPNNIRRTIEHIDEQDVLLDKSIKIKKNKK